MYNFAFHARHDCCFIPNVRSTNIPRRFAWYQKVSFPKRWHLFLATGQLLFGSFIVWIYFYLKELGKVLRETCFLKGPEKELTSSLTWHLKTYFMYTLTSCKDLMKTENWCFSTIVKRGARKIHAPCTSVRTANFPYDTIFQFWL